MASVAETRIERAVGQIPRQQKRFGLGRARNDDLAVRLDRDASDAPAVAGCDDAVAAEGRVEAARERESRG
jgi:hypothetical protein